jgi:hypothetical protein
MNLIKTNKKMKPYLYLLLFLPLAIFSQNLPYETPAFKAIEKKFKIEKRQVYWDFYNTQAVQGDSLYQLITFPIVKREQGAVKIDLYVINYHTAKQKIKSYYKGENQWSIAEDNALRGLEIVPHPQQLNTKTPAYQLRAFFSNSVRYKPTGREELLWLIPKGKKLHNIFTANVMTYSGKIEGGELSAGHIPCNGSKEETTSHFSILPHKVYGFFALMEHRTTNQIQIVPDAEGFCNEELSAKQETMIEWQYNKKEKHYKPINELAN